MSTATDDFAQFAGPEGALESPARNAFAVTTHDTNEIANVSRGVYVGGAGDLKVTMVGVGTVTFKAVPAGTLLPIRVKIIFATGTTATDIVVVY